jgi:predicted metal-dependent phosphoesterase TrpH
MISLKSTGFALLGVAIAAGTGADRPQAKPPLSLGGYRVLAADFHIHTSTWSDSVVSPIGLVLEARRQGLDAIAITGHNQILEAKTARWFAGKAGGPTVLVGQEILSSAHHVIAVGIEQIVDWRLDVAGKADAIHRQGGIAIAAHPVPDYWPAYDAGAIAKLDGAEICHPLVFGNEEAQRHLEQFAAKGRFAAIGSSDFHAFGRVGMCRTYVFARDDSAAAILEAIRARRTVVYAPGGKTYGDPESIALAESVPALREAATIDPSPSVLEWISRLAGLVGMTAIVFGGVGRRDARAAADAAI